MTNELRPYGRRKRAQRRQDWYVLVAAPGKEFLAQRTLRQMGYNAMVPSREVFRYRNKFSRQKEPKRYPCMPRYVLVGFSEVPNWMELLDLPMISGVLAQYDAPAKVKYRHIAHLIALDPDGIVERAGPEQRYMRTHHEFGLGQIVRVARGSLEGFTFTVEAFNGTHASGTIEICGRPAPVNLPVYELEPKDAA